MVDYFYDVKNYLDITFDDTEAEEKLNDICVRAESYLSQKAGADLSFSRNMKNQYLLQLLFDCIRYIWSGALDDFAANYADEIFALRANVHAGLKPS